MVRVAVLERASHHATDDVVLGDALIHVQGLDGQSVTDDGGRICDVYDLVELVGNHDARDSLALEVADQVEQVSRVLVVQRGGGLVQDEELHALGERLCDFDELLLANTKLSDWRYWVFVESHASQQLCGFSVGLVPVNKSIRLLLVA